VSERLAEILDAACDVIARAGSERLRVSDVARAAGVSTALVHYYVPTRSELLRRAFVHADVQVDRRVLAEIAALPTAAARLRHLLSFYLGDDPLVHRNALLWREMWSAAVFDNALRQAVADSYSVWLEQVRDAITAAVEEGSATTDDVPGAALRLAALVDGLASQHLLRMVSTEQALRQIGDALTIEVGL
jgi:AcrR family transcriptional regulator